MPYVSDPDGKPASQRTAGSETGFLTGYAALSVTETSSPLQDRVNSLETDYIQANLPMYYITTASNYYYIATDLPINYIVLYCTRVIHHRSDTPQV